MDFQALKVLQERVEKLAGEMMLADFESESSVRQLLDQVLDIAERAEAQGLLPESRLCQQLVHDFTAPFAQQDGSFESRLGSMVAALQGLLGGGVTREKTPEPVRALEPRNGWEHSLASLPTYVSEAILKDFIENLGSTLDEIQHLLLSLEQEFREDELAELRRHLHTIKSDAGLLGQKDIERLCHLAEDLLRACMDRLAPEPLFLTWDWLKRQLDWVRGSSEAPESPDGILVLLKNAALEMDALAGSRGGAHTLTGVPSALGGSAPAAQTDDFDDLFSSETEFPRRDVGIRFTVLEDSPIFRDFLSESLENLENLDVLLLRLEHLEGTPEDINAVFRAFHTIKGLAGFFALDVIKNLAHQAESILDRCRHGDRTLTGPILDLLFDCKDQMKRILLATEEALTGGTGVVELDAMPDLHSALEKAWAEPPQNAARIGTDERRLGEILLEKNAIDDAVLAEMLQLQQDANPARLGDILVAQGMTSRRLVDKALERQQAGEHHPVGTLLVAERQLDPEDLEAALSMQGDHQPRLGEVLVRSGQVSPQEVRRALQSQRPRSGGSAGVSESNLRDSVKVDAHRLDQLVDTIGELVIAESMVVQHPDLKHFHRCPTVARLFGQLDKISRDLQEMATDLRLVSIRPVFDKMARLARDLSRKTSKPLRFHMEGEETMLDKNVVDRIGDPLLHLIRNAVDHGLESDGTRRAASGKPAHGNLTLRAWQRGGSIWIEVEDDGKGLDVESIRATAIRKGLLDPDADCSPAELQQLIFLPGFSTSREITDISGRGVGMDVVAQAISSLRGTIHLDSEPGRGTVFRIQLPLTLAIIEGMLVRAGQQTYVLPMQAITRLVEPGTARVENILGRGRALTQPEGLVPLISLTELFGMETRESRNPVLLVLEHLEQRIALQVDEVLGQQQVVIKSLGDGLRGIPGISGGCILADGRVGLILDVGGLQPKGQEFLRHIRAGGLKTAEDGLVQGR